MSLSMNGHQRAPRMPHMPAWRPAFPGVDKAATWVTDLRIKRLQVRILPGAPSIYQPDNAFSSADKLIFVQERVSALAWLVILPCAPALSVVAPAMAHSG